MHPLLKKNKKAVLIIGIAAAVLLLAGVRHLLTRSGGDTYNERREKAKAASRAIPAVQAFKVGKKKFVDNLVLTGSLQGGARVEMRFNREGRIEKINVGVGDKVKKGTVIAQLEVGEARIKRQQAEAELSQAVDLYKSGVIAKPRLTQARLAAELARKEYNRSFLKTVREGSIGELNAQAGEFVTTQMTVATLVSVKNVFVEMGVIEKDLSKLHLNQSVSVEVETYPDVTFTGKITRISPVVEGQSRTRTVRAEIPNPESLLLPGMFAQCRIFIQEKADALVVPAAAVQSKDSPAGKTHQVFLLTGDNLVKAVPVEVGYESADYTEIVKGVSPGDRVVASVTNQIRDAVQVEVIEETAYESD